MNWVFAAYTVFWIAIFSYTVLISRKQKELDRKIKELQAIIDEEANYKNQ